MLTRRESRSIALRFFFPSFCYTQVWQVKKIRNTQICDLRKAAGFFHTAKSEASLDIGTDFRNFVSENPQTRIVLWINKESAIQYQHKITFSCKDLRLSRNKIVPKVRKID